MTETVDVAVVQQPPVLLDRKATLDRVVRTVAETAADGAGLVVFPETYVPGYPVYVWRLTPGDPADYRLGHELHRRLLEEAVDLDAGDLRPVVSAAREHGVTVVIGVHERDAAFSRGSLYNTQVTITPEAGIVNRHRKLVPTHVERLVWAPGDAAGLQVIDLGFGRLGGLICWESYMPLARFSLYAQGVQVYVASTWDEGDAWVATMRHIAREGRCWVIGSGCSMTAGDIPAGFPERERLFPDEEEWLNTGDSVIVAPDGSLVAGPLRREHGILRAVIDPGATAAARYMLDAAGHYHRPDVFTLTVDRSRRSAIAFTDTGDDGMG